MLAFASVGAPHVTGPRTTTSERPVYRFRAAHAVGFRCAFDSRQLHGCKARYSQRLDLGRHVLRVRAVGRGHALSRTVTVRVVVKSPYPSLSAGPPLAVGAGAGVPAEDPGGLWVPVTATGDLARVDPGGGSVTAKVHVGQPPSGSGFLDSAIFAGGSVWAASDSGGTIARVDPTTGAVTGTIAVPPRPGGLAAGGGSVWAFHFQSSSVTRIDAASGIAHTLTVGDANATGIAYGGGSLWLLTQLPSRVLRVDPSSGAVLQSIALSPPYARKHSLIDTWWLAYGDGAVWATLPNYEGVARIDAVTGSVRYARTPYGEPFGVAEGGGSAWVATDHGVLRLDATTGSPTGVALLPIASQTGFVSITYSNGVAWFTNYDRGTLTKVSG